MSQETHSAAPRFAEVLPPEVARDTQAVMEKLTTGKPLDADTYRRIRDRADRVRDAIFREHELLDIGVPAIRELREGV
jgi:hypothetical protein